MYWPTVMFIWSAVMSGRPRLRSGSLSAFTRARRSMYRSFFMAGHPRQLRVREVEGNPDHGLPRRAPPLIGQVVLRAETAELPAQLGLERENEGLHGRPRQAQAQLANGHPAEDPQAFRLPVTQLHRG